MPPTAPSRRALWSRFLAASAVLTVAASLLVGIAGTASADTTRTWNLSGVTFSDGGQMTGSFVLSDTGVMSAVNITTGGGDTGSYGTSTTYDASNSGAYEQWPGAYAVIPNGVGISRYVLLDLGDLSAAADGDVVPLSANQSYECMNCSPYRYVVSGSIIAGPLGGAPAVTGTPTITSTGTGAPLVGQTLTGDDSELSVTPQGATKTYAWLRDGSVIPGATDTSYTLSNDDAGHMIAFQVGASEQGYADATPATSEPVGPVDGGQITLPSPEITGTPVVDGILSAALPDGLDPADADVSWQWFRGTDPVGEGLSTYTPTADDAGQVLTVTATAGKDHFEATSESTDTAEVDKASFADAPAPTISGTIKVGQTLTADPGSVVPEPDGFDFQWYSDEEPIIGATNATYVLGSAQRHTTMTVEVTATKAGYDEASATSDPTGEVATDLAPDLSFDATHVGIRRGQSTTLDWSTTDADTVTASGAWTGSKSSAGTADVAPNTLGENTYVLSATNANGTTTSQVAVTVTRPAAQLTVTTPEGLHLAGRPVTVSTDGLESNEPYTITVDGVQVALGQATANGELIRTLTVPAATGDHTGTVTVIGSETDRTGTTTLQVVVKKALGLGVAKKVMHKRHRQWITVTGLVAGEHVRVAYRGKRISPITAHADPDGTYRVAVHVGRLAGTKTVTATGAFYGRRAVTTFIVKKH
jgi:hypothetical protein